MSKRQRDDEQGTARERKKRKMADARRIPVQETPSTSSKTVVQFDSMQGLPTSIDVERFTEARAYEIDAMQKAIQTAGDSATHRAWQTLPRHLRRRAASHDVRRVPVRLRDKARAEMDTPKRRPHAQPKRGKTDRTTRTQDLLKRQHDKSWLETHIWHAKRAKMQTMWGYRLAITPTEKAFRPSHRASMHGAILHDASYYATIEIKGPQLLLQATLERCCDPQTSGMKRCMTGGRACETHVYKHARYPFGLLGPMTILWQPLPPASDASPEAESSAHAGKDKGEEKGKGKGKGKEKEKEKQTDDSTSTSKPRAALRVLWVRCHPAIFEDVFQELQTSASYVLEQSKKKDPGVHAEIELADLRGCINAFEIMGPKSSQVIKGALTLAGNEDRKDVKKLWEALADLQTTGSVPRGMVMGLRVLDPRLKFPPKNAQPHYPDFTRPSTQASPAFFFPTALTAQSDIWDEDKRGSLKEPKYKKKDIDARRSKNLVPGTPLNPLRQDDRIPILVVQRSVEPGLPTASTACSSDNTPGIHGWTLLFPAGWAMPFLSSLVHTGTRFAGQRERLKQCFEAGACGFPEDYPGTGAHDVVMRARAAQGQSKWERTPKAKKPNYMKLGTRSAWRPDWEVVLGLEGGGAQTWGGEQEQEEQELVPAQRPADPDADAMQMCDDDDHADANGHENGHQGKEDKDGGVQPWLLRGPHTSTILAKRSVTPTQLLGEMNTLREKHGLSALEEDAETMMQSALVMVRATMARRGAPTEMAIMYRMEDDEARRWIEAVNQAGDVDADAEPAHELGERRPPQDMIVGYVTTGDVSLARGHGFAIGAVSVVQYGALSEQAVRLGRPNVVVKIRDRDGTTCRLAWLEVVDA